MNLLLAIIFYQALWTDVLSQKISNIYYKSLGDNEEHDDNSDIKWNFGEKGEEISRMSDVFETSLEIQGQINHLKARLKVTSIVT